MPEGQAAAPAASSDALASPASIVSRIDAILSKENAPPPAAAAAQEPAPGQGESQPEEAEVEPGPNKGVEGEEQPPEAKETAEIPLEQLEAIQLDVEVESESGKVTEKPTIKELKLGYMRQKDYQKKTAELARQREEVPEKTRQAIESERNKYAQQLQQLHDVILETAAPELKDVDWNKLATNDAFEYVRLRNRADQIKQALSTIETKQKEVATKREAEFKELRTKAATKARETLEADIPGFNDALYQSLMKAGEKFGYKPEEVGTWVDPRAIKLLHAAMQGQQVAPAKPSADKKVVTVPKVVKPGPSAENSQAMQRHASAMKQLQKSGTVQDAAAVIRARLGG